MNMGEREQDLGSCMGSYGGPVFPYTALGGFLSSDTTDLGKNPPYTNSTALIVTFPVNNHVNQSDNLPALDWEQALLKYIENYSHPLLDIAYSAERSVQDELNRESQADVFTVIISYSTSVSASVGGRPAWREWASRAP